MAQGAPRHDRRDARRSWRKVAGYRCWRHRSRQRDVPVQVRGRWCALAARGGQGALADELEQPIRIERRPSAEVGDRLPNARELRTVRLDAIEASPFVELFVREASRIDTDEVVPRDP